MALLRFKAQCRNRTIEVRDWISGCSRLLWEKVPIRADFDFAMYKSHIIYRMNGTAEVIRYTILERMDDQTYSTLHADYLRPDERKHDAYLARLTVERLLEFDPADARWFSSIKEAIEHLDNAVAEMIPPPTDRRH